MDVLSTIGHSPYLALLGAAGLLTVLLVPLVLKAAGLSGSQIVETIRLTLRFFSGVVSAFRDENKNGKQPPL